MKLSCPNCSQRISLDDDSLATLAGAAGFGCPVCGSFVPLPPGGDGDAPARQEEDAPPPRWEAPEAAEIARTFDQRYRIGRIIGRGGMGAVYEGFDTRLERRVAVKILPAETVGDAGALARFEREAKTMAALDHPNIVHIHDYGRTAEGHPFLIMEFIDGMDVHALRHSGQLDLPGALEIVSQVCSALHYAHSRSIIHRDIKPANILVTREGVAKVGDFGLAKVLVTGSRPQAGPSLTLSGTLMGTPDYIAPEQFDGQSVDHRADIYALGVMLYDLLTGSPPRGAWPPPSERVHIDVRLDEIVLRALQQNPSARYQAASEVKGDIDCVKTSTGGGPLPPGANPAPLPSTTSGGAPAAPLPPHAPGGVHKSKTASRKHRNNPPEDEILATTRSLGTTMLVLGLLALLTIGGLALYLANRKTGDTYHTKQTITTSVTHNTYFTQLIAAGLATAEDLSAIGGIRPRGETLIGISKEPLSWDQARALAEKTGAAILSIGPGADAIDPSLIEWLGTSLDLPPSQPLWVLSGNRPHLLSGSSASPVENLAMARKALLLWNMAGNPSSGPFVVPVAGTDKEFTLSGIGFVWVGEGSSGFWVSREEMGSGASPPSAASLRTGIEGRGIPASWTVGLPTLAQWQAARAASQSLGLADFDGGRAEFLSDGRVIGASSFSSAAATRNPATVAERRKLTRRLVTAAQLPSPGRSTGSPAVYSEETDFAHRIVITPQ